MRFKQGDIVLIPFPFTDFSSSKKRPAIILSRYSKGNQDLVVAKVTSVSRNDKFTFDLSAEKLETPLPVQSEVRINQLITVSSSIVIKKMSALKPLALSELLEKVRNEFIPEE